MLLDYLQFHHAVLVVQVILLVRIVPEVLEVQESLAVHSVLQVQVLHALLSLPGVLADRLGLEMFHA